MDNLIKEELGVNVLEPFSRASGGCISQAAGYHTDKLGDVFIKINSKAEAGQMFDGEFASLNAIYETETIRVPKPIKSIKADNQCYLVTEYLYMNGSPKPAELGTKLAKLHAHNAELLKAKEKRCSFIGGAEKGSAAVTQFGFDIPTCCGYIKQVNDWSDDWVEFYSRNRLKAQIDLLLEKKGDRELLDLWPKLERKIPLFFQGCKTIVPSLVHGDLWSGNYSYDEDVVYDPASFYGHSEFEMGIMQMFGGFSSAVYSAYHKIIPEENGSKSRIQLYELFHHLNHWNHFGSGYKAGAISIMKSLISK